MLTTVSAIALVAVALVASWFDLRERRVPNWLTVGGLVIALLLRAPGGLGEVGLGLAGAGICFALALSFFLLGGLGGGDVKLLTTVGAFLGPVQIWTALFVMAIAGGLMALVVIVKNGAVRQTMANLHTILLSFGRKSFRGWKGEGSAVTLETPGVLSVPYAVAISAGALWGWFL